MAGIRLAVVLTRLEVLSFVGSVFLVLVTTYASNCSWLPARLGRYNRLCTGEAAMRLYSLCWLDDMAHWLIIEPDGQIVDRSLCGFATEEDAIADVRWRV